MNWNPFVVVFPLGYFIYKCFFVDASWFRISALAFISLWFLMSVYDYFSNHKLLDWMYSDEHDDENE